MAAELVLITIAAVCFGLITVFQKLASPAHPVIAAIVISVTAAITGMIFYLTMFRGARPEKPQALIFAFLGGLCAAIIDISAMKAYSMGLPLTVGGPVLIGGSIAVATFFGFFTGDAFSFGKLFWIFLIVLGSVALSASK